MVKFHPSESHLFWAIYRGYNSTYNLLEWAHLVPSLGFDLSTS